MISNRHYIALIDQSMHGCLDEEEINLLNDTTREHFHSWRQDQELPIWFFEPNARDNQVIRYDVCVEHPLNFSFSYAVACSEEDVKTIEAALIERQDAPYEGTKKDFERLRVAVALIEVRPHFIAAWA